MSPDIPLKIVEWFFQFGLIGFLLGMMVLYAIFRGWHYYKLLSGESEKHKAVFDEAKQLVRSEHWGTRYRLFLQKVLSKLTGMIGDGYRFPDELPDKPRLRADHPAIEELHKRNPLECVFGVNPFTVEAYEFCFFLAFMYPLFSFLIGWAFGGKGMIGQAVVMSDNSSSIERWALLFILIASISTAILATKLEGWVSKGIGLVAIILAISIYSLGASSVVVFGVAFLVLTISGFFILASSTTPAVTATATVCITIYLSNIVDSYTSPLIMLVFLFFVYGMYRAAFRKSKLGVYWLIHFLIFLAGCLMALSWLQSDTKVLLLIFYLILPLANTPLDWVSLGITRALLQSIRFKQHRFGKALLWGVLDLGLAVIALLLVSGVTVAVVSLANLLAVKPFIDLQALFTSLGSLENWRDNLWIYFMLLSTLLPTAIHFALAGGALTLAVSDKQRRAILKDMDSNDLSAKKAWIYVSIMPAFGFVLAPTLLLFSLYWIIHAHGAFLGNALLSWAELLATWIDPTLGGPA